jgi:hypothetical protein
MLNKGAYLLVNNDSLEKIDLSGSKVFGNAENFTLISLKTK